ncbi:MAG: hypothetical protein ACRDSZ_01170 [Pseudonocardiaceae bacterium]
MRDPVTRPSCSDCGAQLRRDRSPGERCDPCQRKGPRIALPPGFYDQVPLAAALAGLNFGPVFLAIRAHTHWSQQTLGAHVDLDQCRISDIENGRRQLHDFATAVRVCNQLLIPAGALGFVHGVTVSGRINTGRKGKWMDRRDFGQTVATLALAGASGTNLDLDRLLALLDPDPDESGTRQVGAADVAALERVTGEYEKVIHTYGGGYARDAAVAHLRAILPLLGAHVDPAVRGRLHAATAHLALQAGWMSFDLEMHDFARRVWLAGLEIAKGADDPVTTDLTGHLLFVMAQQALYLQRNDEALRLVRLGQAVDAGAHPVSPSTKTTLLVNLAFARAGLGDTRACRRALGEAEEEFVNIDLVTAAPWACVDGSVKLTTWRGHACYELGRTRGDQDSLEQALAALTVAPDNPRAMSRALYLPDLAGAHALTGDIGTAVAVGHQAVELANSLHSRRVQTRLAVLHTVLEPMHTSPGVAELRERLTTSAA